MKAMTHPIHPFKPVLPPPEGEDDRPVLGITLGDPAGVGPEIIHEALNSGMMPTTVRFRILGDASGITAGIPSRESAQKSIDALDEAVALLRSGEIKGVVTGPVHKGTLYAMGFDFPGQTEYFARAFDVEDYGMCLTGPHLTVSLATIHIPLREVPNQLSVEGIVRSGRLLHKFLRMKGHAHPHIAVAGLNPHAGEGGNLGSEEEEIIAPAVALLNQEFPKSFQGPYPPDSLFYHAYRRDYHGVVCMYHDQGLIPLKMVDFREGVNVTLGLPFVRTSPDHGTAFDIAGRGIARPDSMMAAIRLACYLLAHKE